VIRPGFSGLVHEETNRCASNVRGLFSLFLKQFRVGGW